MEGESVAKLQTAYNHARAVRAKFETVPIDAGETPLGTLTMATHPPRRKIKARVIREADWRKIMKLVCTAWSADPDSDSGRELLISDAVAELKEHLRSQASGGGEHV
jgi:hypothetical protein